MRLGRMRELLDWSVPILAVKTTVQDAGNIGGNSAQKLAGIHGSHLRAALNHLATIPGLKKQASEILARPLVRNAHDNSEPTSTKGSGDVQMLKNALDELFSVAEALRQTLEEIAPPSEEDRLYVKLPDDVSDLGSLERSVEELRTAIEMPVRLLTGEQVVFRGVERGSVWLVLGLVAGVFQATKALIGICDKFARKQQERDDAERVMRELGAFNDEIGQSAKDGLRMYGLALAKELDDAFASVHPADHAADVPQKLLHSIEVLTGLYHRGVKLQLTAAKNSSAAERPEADETLKQLSVAVVKLLGDGKQGNG